MISEERGKKMEQGSVRLTQLFNTMTAQPENCNQVVTTAKGLLDPLD